MGAGFRPAIMQGGIGCISTVITGEMCVHVLARLDLPARIELGPALGDVIGVGTRARVNRDREIPTSPPMDVTERHETHE
jgi:hypothetical protein